MEMTVLDYWNPIKGRGKTNSKGKRPKPNKSKSKLKIGYVLYIATRRSTVQDSTVLKRRRSETEVLLINSWKLKVANLYVQIWTRTTKEERERESASEVESVWRLIKRKKGAGNYPIIFSNYRFHNRALTDDGAPQPWYWSTAASRPKPNMSSCA